MSKVIILGCLSFLTFYNSIEYKPIILHCQIQRNLCLNILPVIFLLSQKRTLVKNDTGLDDLKLRQQVSAVLIPMEEPTMTLLLEISKVVESHYH